MSEEDRRILSYVTRDVPGNAAMVGEAVRILARLALADGAKPTPPYHHLGIEADGFITVYPQLKS